MTIDYLPWNRPAVLAGRVCMRDTNAELTYAEVARRVDAVAGQFAAAGVGRGTWSPSCCPTGWSCCSG